VTAERERTRPVTRYALVRIQPRRPRLDLESFSRAARLHPDLVRRLLALGLLEVSRDSGGTLWLDPEQLREIARIQRLHASFPLDYAACGLVTALLDRIAELEAALRRSGQALPERPDASPQAGSSVAAEGHPPVRPPTGG
jgi:chaperone modulatory protein CbpM